MRDEKLLSAEDCFLLVCDVQEAFLPHIDEIARVVERCRIMIETAKLLSVPIIATEQYPKGLSHTVEPLREALGQSQKYFDKVTFNCLGNEAVRQAVLDTGCKQALLIGIETHICIAQTTCGLLADGIDTYLPADAIGSRLPYDRHIALERLRQAGAVVTTTEAAIMEMTGSSKHKKFKAISSLIKSGDK